MCGITGIFAFNDIGRVHMIHLARATELLAHRGPDFQDAYNDDDVGLGHRRLSVIDTNFRSHQPMADPTGRYVLVFNGEVYNYEALRRELRDRGHEFTTRGDTEVLLHMLIEYGEQAMDRLEGFFAFAFYDRELRTLLLARDRLGIKPLYWHQGEDLVCFGSELDSVLAYNIPKAVNPEALELYLQLNYVPAPFSMVTGVSKLLPGHAVRIRPHQVETFQWYKVPTLEQPMLSYAEAVAELKEKLDQAVKQRLVADVPLGSFLSGGLDSSIVAALASRHLPELNTYSVGYTDAPYFDESGPAEAVAQHLGTRHHRIDLSLDELYEAVNPVLDSLSEPFADSSALPMYLLSQRTRLDLTVALSGDGADEVFAGYTKYSAHLGADRRSVQNGLVRAAMPLLWALPKGRHNAVANKVRQLHRYGQGLAMDAGPRYMRWLSMLPRKEASLLVKGHMHKDYYDLKAYAWQGLVLNRLGNATMNEVLASDQRVVLPDDMLCKVDRMSMAHGLEVRVPFLDHRLVEWANSLPADFKIDSRVRKKILRDAFGSLLPAETLTRPKRGFEVPMVQWLRGPMKKRIVNDWLSEDLLEEQGIFDTQRVLRLRRKLFGANPGDSHATVWALIVFNHWWRRHFKA